MTRTLEEIRKEMFDLATEYIAIKESTQDPNVAKQYVQASGKSIGKEELINMIDASLDMNLTAGRYNDAFEKELAQKIGVKHVVTTNSGSSANLLAFSSLMSHKLKDKRLKKGDEVIAVATCFPTTLNPIIQNGLVPVFVDVEIGTYNIDVSKIENAITPKTRAIFLAHALGNMFDIEKIIDLSKKYNLWVIEDACDALGAEWQGKYAGTFGHIATCSFYPAHHLTMGEGGAVLTSNFTLWRIILSYREWGRDCWCKPGCDNTCTKRFEQQFGKLPFGYDHKYTFSHIGYNLKITDWQAAIGLAQLQKLDFFLAKRRENAKYLLSKLQDLTDYLILPTVDKRCNCAWFGFLISVKEDAPFTRNEITKYLEDHGVGTRLLFAGNVLRQPLLTENDVVCRIGNSENLVTSKLGEKDFEKLPNTEFIMNNTFWVGVAQNVNLVDLDKTSATIHEFINSKSKI